ncbi:MAG: 30S ribosome-binding factor RbfA [Firmicutes bacterium]|nr:30S ribosome-binding factor RbfA [Bacillota bacterium]
MNKEKGGKGINSTSAFMGRVNADIFRLLTLALKKSGDEAVIDVHILRVEASADLSTARVFVNKGVRALDGMQGFFHTEIANGMKIRRVPKLRFIVDDGAQNAARVDELLSQIKGDA